MAAVLTGTVLTTLAGAEMYWALNEAKRGLWFEWWFEELVQAAADRVKAEATGDGGGWQAPWRLLHGLAAIGSPALRTAAMQAAKDADRALMRQQSSAAPDWLGPCPQGSVTSTPGPFGRTSRAGGPWCLPGTRRSSR